MLLRRILKEIEAWMLGKCLRHDYKKQNKHRVCKRCHEVLEDPKLDWFMREIMSGIMKEIDKHDLEVARIIAIDGKPEDAEEMELGDK